MSKSALGRDLAVHFWRLGFLAFCGLCLAATARGELSATWPDLKKLTPETLIHCFADFGFQLSDQVQDAGTFVERKRGDCADFSKLAAEILNRHGYTAKLVVVMMEQQMHVVCYVEESKGYLDYNLRAAAQPVVSSDGTLEDIADKVAASFHSKWRMASEIRYSGVDPVFLFSAFPPARRQAETAVQLADKTTPAARGLQSLETSGSAEKAAGSKPLSPTP